MLPVSNLNNHKIVVFFYLIVSVSMYLTVSIPISLSLFSFILVFLLSISVAVSFSLSLSLSSVSHACSFLSYYLILISVSLFSLLPPSILILTPVRKHRPSAQGTPAQYPRHSFHYQGLTRNSSFSQSVSFVVNSPDEERVVGETVLPQDPFTVTLGLICFGPSLCSSCPCEG